MSSQQQPSQPPPTQSYERPYYGSAFPPLPRVNGELVLFVLVWVVVLVVTLAADSVDWPAFVTASVVLASAYMIARGIAKAGKVLED